MGKNDRETQPHYYEDTFRQLVNNLLHLEQEAKLLEIQNKQTVQDEKIKNIEAKISTSNSDYYSVSGYASLKGYKHLDIRKANLIGRLAAKLSKEYGVDIGKVKDERYGNVNIYHIDILHEAFTRKI